MPSLPPPERLTSRDARDLPGTDDHTRLMHPHGDAISVVGFFLTDDPTSYAQAAVLGHQLVSAAYLDKCARAAVHPAPLCDATHAEIVPDVADLPHTLRPGAVHMLAAGPAHGHRVGILRVWRHHGLDCDAAERETACQHQARRPI